MSADVPAKYLNSPDTPLFNKGRLLYNYHPARQPAHDRGTVIAVEGYVDVISLERRGLSPCGRAARHGADRGPARPALAPRDEPILCFDGDKAGQRAAYRALDVALPNLTAGKSLRFAMLPEGQDPDDLARAGGSAAVERVLARRPAPRGHALGAGDRGGPARYAGAAGGPGAAPARITCADSRRNPQALLPGGGRKPAFGLKSRYPAEPFQPPGRRLAAGLPAAPADHAERPPERVAAARAQRRFLPGTRGRAPGRR